MPIVYVEDLETLRQCYKDVRAAGVVGLDYETTGLDPHKDCILLAQFATPEACYVIPYPRYQTHVAVVLELLTQPGRLTLAHNASFEYQFTLSHTGLHLARVYDTMVAEAVLTAGLDEPLDLGAVALRRLGLELDKGLQKSFVGADPETFTATPEQVAYAASDALIMHDLYNAQKPLLQDEGLYKTAALEFQALPVFAQMEYHGMKLDLAAHAEVLDRYKADADYYGVQAAATLDPFWQAVAGRNRLHDADCHFGWQRQIDNLLAPHGGRLKKDSPEDLREQVKALRVARDKHKPKPEAPINLNSGQQVLAALAESGISLPNLQADTVEDYAHKSPVLGAYAKWAKAQKVVSTYGDSMAARTNPETGRIHFGYRQVVSTGRTSSDGAQVMPPEIRACFVPEPEHVYVVADFSSMEPRIAAGLSGDAQFIADYAAGIDPYRAIAAQVWPDRFPTWKDVPKPGAERDLCKIALLAAIYGASAYGLVLQGIPDEPTATALLNGISTKYPAMSQWCEDNRQLGVSAGYVSTALGRKRYFRRLPPEPRSYDAKKDWRKMRGAIRRAAGNMPVQGTGADIAKRSMVLIARKLATLGYGRIVGMVHDEILTEAPRQHADGVRAIVGASMEEAGAEMVQGVPIPAEVHITERWEK